MNNTFFPFVLLLVSLSLFSCEEPLPTGEGTFILSFSRNGDTGQSIDGFPVFQNQEGRNFYFENLSFYVSDITLRKEGGDTLNLVRESDESSTILFDWVDVRTDSDGETLSQKFTVPAGNYTSVTFSIGVPNEANHSDPTNYPAEHPLSEFRGKHWTWNAGYRFIMADGFVDSTQTKDGAMDSPFLYHCGTDALYETLTYTGYDIKIENGSIYTFDFDFDPAMMFSDGTENVDMINDNITHTGDFPTIARTVTDNFVKNALKKK